MYNALTTGEAEYRLIFDHKMTFEFVAELEEMIIDALRRYTHVEVDLSRVLEIDLCGMNLLGFLKCFVDKGLVIVATSPAVERAYERLTAPPCTSKSQRVETRRPLARGAASRRNASAT